MEIFFTSSSFPFMNEMTIQISQDFLCSDPPVRVSCPPDGELRVSVTCSDVPLTRSSVSRQIISIIKLILYNLEIREQS